MSATPYIAGNIALFIICNNYKIYRLCTTYLLFAGLTNKNIFLVDFKEPYAEKNLRDESTPNIRSIIFSPKGTYLAYRTDKKLVSISFSIYI